MAGFQRSIVIPRPVEEVFDYATSPDHASKLLPGLIKIEWLTEGGSRPGARFRETRVVDGRKRTVVIEVVEHDRPRVYTARSAMLGIRGTYHFRFAPEGTGTRVDLQAEVTGHLLWKPFLGMIRRVMEKEDGDYLKRLHEAMEQPGPS